MTKRSALLPAILLTAAIAACSSSTSPGSNNNSGTHSPGSAQKGDKVNFSGTYALSSFTFDSTDGGHWSANTDANDGATLTLGTTTYTLASTGNFTQAITATHGSYTATDTSSAAQRGTLVLYDSVAAKSQPAQYSYANTTLTVTIPNGDGSGNAIVTIWNKQ